MEIENTRAALTILYPPIASLPPNLFAEVLQNAKPIVIPAGAVMFDEASPCRAFPMVLKGTIRVVKAAPTGRELELYQVGPGESCIMSIGCLLGSKSYSARGIAEGEVTLMTLGYPLFNRLMEQHAPFRNYIIGLFSTRLVELMELVEQVAFRKLDQRLASLLVERGPVIYTTHQGLALELGSVREIVSRLLASFTKRGLVSLGREKIEVVDASSLEKIAKGEA